MTVPEKKIYPRSGVAYCTNPGERERAAALSRFIRFRRRVRRKRSNFFGGEHAPRRRNCFLTGANGREGGLPPDQ